MEQLTKKQFEECKKQFLALGETALTLNHYQLAMETTIENPLIWKMFLLDPRISEYVNSEMSIIRNAGINEIIKQAPSSRSVGQAQLINALVKIDEASANKEGPVFIYSYVPLNEEQKFAPNVVLPNTEIEQLQDDEPEEEEIIIDERAIPTSIPKK